MDETGRTAPEGARWRLLPIGIALWLATIDITLMFQPLAIVNYVASAVVFVFFLIKGLRKATSARKRMGASSYLIAATILGLLFFSPVRATERHILYFAKIILNNSEYEKDLVADRANGSTGGGHHEWDWMRSQNSLVILVFDKHDQTRYVATDSKLSGVCATSVERLKGHYFVVEVYCP